MKNQPETMKNHEKTVKGGGAGTEKGHTRGVTTDLWDGGGGGAGITQKRDTRGVTTDLLDV